MVDKSNAESVYNKARSFYGGHEKSSNKAYIGSNITLLMGPSDDLPLAADNLAAAKQIPVAEAMLTVKGRWNNHMALDQHQLKDVLGGKPRFRQVICSIIAAKRVAIGRPIAVRWLAWRCSWLRTSSAFQSRTFG